MNRLKVLKRYQAVFLDGKLVVLTTDKAIKKGDGEILKAAILEGYFDE